MTALSSLVGMSSEALLSGKGFSIPDLPAKLEGVSKEDAAKCAALGNMLPRIKSDDVVILNLNAYKISSASTTEAIRALKSARSDGSEIWVVIREAK
jgi:hypothetical protein